MEGSPQHGDTFSVIFRFQKSWEKKLRKKSDFAFFEMSAFETE